MGKTSIEWTDHSWPIINGCRRISPGCGGARGVGGCYAERLISTRLSKTKKYGGLARFGKNGPQWTGATRLWLPDLDMPIRLRKPSRIFVADMGDLFYEAVTNEEIAAVFGVMAAASHHTFQVLTKRATRMREWFELPGTPASVERFRHIAEAGRIQEYFAPERESEVAAWPGYFVTTKGRVLSGHGSETCLWCNKALAADSLATKQFCSSKCRAKAAYERRCGRWPRRRRRGVT